VRERARRHGFIRRRKLIPPARSAATQYALRGPGRSPHKRANVRNIAGRIVLQLNFKVLTFIRWASAGILTRSELRTGMRKQLTHSCNGARAPARDGLWIEMEQKPIPDQNVTTFLRSRLQRVDAVLATPSQRSFKETHRVFHRFRWIERCQQDRCSAPRHWTVAAKGLHLWTEGTRAKGLLHGVRRMGSWP
jgi:hypothetical protein